MRAATRVPSSENTIWAVTFMVGSHAVFAYEVDSEFLTESDKKMKV